MSTVEVKTSVARATIYTDRAAVTRSSRVSLDPKTTAIQVVHLPMEFDSDSVRISAYGPAGLTILDYKVGEQEFRDVPETALRTLEEERQRFQDQIVAMRDEIAALEHQKQFLQGISVGKTRHFSKDLDVQRPLLDDWKAVLDFLGREQRDLDMQRRELDLRIRKVERDIAMIEAELKKHGRNRVAKRRVVTVEVEATVEGEWTLELTYLMSLAGWRPIFDARVDTKAKEVLLRYQGVVWQKSGEDWTGIEVLLSTARPQLGGNAPELRPWNLHQQLPLPPQAKSGGAARSAAPMMRMSMQEVADEAEEYAVTASAEQASGPPRATVEAGQGSAVVFRTGGRGDVPGDGSEAKLLVMEDKFENRFRYLTVPKLAQWVYLTAEVVNSTEYPLLPGAVHIFLDGTFVGKSSIGEVRLPGEKFDLHLGVDESIKVTRKLQRQKGGDKGLFTRSHVEDYSYLITLESLRDTAEEVLVQDQIPVSNDEKIKVETKLIQPSENPEKDKDKLPLGTVEWRLTLAPRTTQKINLEFEVTHPKDVRVYGMEG